MRRPGDLCEHDVKMTGFFLATSPGVVPEALNHPVQLEDFAPTTASLLGVSLDDTAGVPTAAVCNSNTM